MNPSIATDRTHQPSRLPKLKLKLSTVIVAILAIVWLLFSFYPIFYIMFSSFHDQKGFLIGNIWLPPADPTIKNYVDVINAGFVRFFLNSAFVSVISVLCIVTFSLMASFVLVNVKTATSRSILNLFLVALAIPIQALIIPIYTMVYRANLYDNLWGIILPSIAFGLPLTILILVNFLRDIPSSLYEAMIIDGVGEYSLLYHLVIPLSIPALFAVGIYQFIQVWNNFLFPLVLTQSENKRLLPLAVFAFVGEHSVNVPGIMAAVVLSALPLILGYIFSRKYLLAAMSAAMAVSK